MSSHPSDAGSSGTQRSRKESSRRIAVGILAAVAVLFAVLNFEDVKVNLLFGSVTMPLIIVIVGCLLIGGLIGGYLGRRSGRRRS